MTNEEAQERLSKLFDECSVDIKKRSVRITNMYAVPNFIDKISDPIAVAIGAALGLRLKRIENIANQGCETCDYGSEYGWEFEIIEDKS